jgi:aspartate/glutamate racemase
MSATKPSPAGPISRIGLIHTVSSLSALFVELAGSLLPDVSLINLTDETLLRDAIAAGGLTPSIEQRLARHVEALAMEGADAVMVTCSSLGPAVDTLAAASPLPLLRVDSAMADKAVRAARRVGVLATLPTTMNPTIELVRARAAAIGASVTVVAHLCEGAFAALQDGDITRHDELVRAGLRALEPQVDLVILAQASMARVLLSDGVPCQVPILASPGLAVEHLAHLVADRHQSPGPEEEK